MRRLLITADELGITMQRSHGIFLCHEQGSVTGASLIVNAGTSHDAAKRAKERNLPTGLEINLTDGSPISKPSDISSLLTTDGYFLGHASLLRNIDEGNVELRHVEREVRAQLEWFLDHHGQPTHVTGFYHIHVHPFFVPILLPILERYSISFVRIPSEPVPPFGYEIDKHLIKEVQGISVLADQARALYAAHGIRSTDNFRGGALVGYASQRNLRHILGRLPEGTTELMVHPGSPTASPDPFEGDPQRQTEINMLLADSLKEELIEREIKLCSFEDLY